MGVQIFVIVTKLNVFVSVTKTIALFVLIMVIMVILIMFHHRYMNSMLKKIEKDLGDNYAPVLRSSKKKGENLMSWWDK